VWAKVSTVKDEDGRPLGAVAVNRDMSSVHKMQDALQAAEQRYRSLFEDAPAMYVTAERRDGKLVIVDCNALFVATLCYTREDLLGRPLASLLAPESAGTLLRHHLRSGALLGGEECAVVTSDNRTLEMLLRTRYERDEQGRITSLRAMFVDISERKRMERQLRETSEQLHALGRHLESIREQEQRRIAREIHDELGQMLTVFKLDLAWLGRHAPHCGPEVTQKLAAMTEHTGATIRTVQRIAAELRPAILDNLGLVAAVEWLARNFEVRTGIVCTFTYNDAAALLHETDLATALFRVCQEALTNVARHAQASSVHLRLHVTQAEILLEIQDDGIGITAEQVSDPNSFGMLGMRERLYPWDGRLSVESAPREGTRLCIAIDRLPTMENAE
jgi:PAS domain S-box-containing protein